MINKIKTIFEKKKLQIKKKIRGKREGIEGKEEAKKEKELKEDMEQETKCPISYTPLYKNPPVSPKVHVQVIGTSFKQTQDMLFYLLGTCICQPFCFNFNRQGKRVLSYSLLNPYLLFGFHLDYG